MLASVNHSYAFVMSPRLGDSLLSMIVVHNLARHGYRIKVFGDQIHALRDWFPGFDIAPGLTPHDASSALAPYDVILHAYHADKVLPPGDRHANVIVMDDWPIYRQIRNMVDIQLDVCRVHFGLTDLVRENGIAQLPSSAVRATAPGESERSRRPLTPRGDMRRVVIHPVASDSQKSWRPKRFVALALQLRARGFDPEFVLPQSALENWRWLPSYGLRAYASPDLSQIAERIVTAGWVIGNDSGLGHLASSLGVPTVALAMRPRIAARWQPGWAPSEMVLPLPVVPGRFLKETCWKYLVSSARVLRAFDILRRRCGMPVTLHGNAYAPTSPTLAPRPDTDPATDARRAN
ncbi:glycosyltransferase family 9 protein [Robbsia andropogonis]|uniref:glycosyltransferase family 9 protein n=1 Tax=Robbsia andropogonis TaxID=28092 RepID=UPI003D24D199